MPRRGLCHARDSGAVAIAPLVRRSAAFSGPAFSRGCCLGETHARIYSPVTMAPTLPKSLSYLKLVNLEFRGKALDVEILRLPSGRVVRRMTFKAAGHS